MFGAAAAVVAVLQYYLSGHSSRDIPSPSFIQPVAQGPWFSGSRECVYSTSFPIINTDSRRKVPGLSSRISAMSTEDLGHLNISSKSQSTCPLFCGQGCSVCFCNCLCDRRSRPCYTKYSGIAPLGRVAEHEQLSSEQLSSPNYVFPSRMMYCWKRLA